MADSPGILIPAQYNPNDDADQNRHVGDPKAAAAKSFTIQMGVRTLDADLGADTHYFSEAKSSWSANFVWPLAAPNVSLVTLGPAWKAPGTSTEIIVNVVPSTINSNAPFARWIRRRSLRLDGGFRSLLHAQTEVLTQMKRVRPRLSRQKVASLSKLTREGRFRCRTGWPRVSAPKPHLAARRKGCPAQIRSPSSAGGTTVSGFQPPQR